MSALPVYPVRVEGRLDPRLSRWLWLVKWLLAIPHFIVLAFLWIAFIVLSVVAFFAILVTGRYPKSIFRFNVGVLRWTWRVGFYAFGANGTDRYPPFALAETDYPARLEVEYPERLSRGLTLVKWWLLAIPHYLVVGFFVGGGTVLAWEASDGQWLAGAGLIAVLTFFAVVALLFTGRYPKGIFDLVLGLNRWALRVAAYAGLMTDRYPPFRLDLGADEPGVIAVDAPGADAPSTAHAGTREWGAGRIVLLVSGVLASLVALATLALGVAAIVVDQTQRDSAGYVMSPDKTFLTTTHALVSGRVELDLGPDASLANDVLGTLLIQVAADHPVFVGIGRAAAVDVYLAGVQHEDVRAVGSDRRDYVLRPGGAPESPPAAQTFWAASTQGAGERELTWDVQDGNWKIVLMNADGSRVVDATVRAGAELPNLLWIGLGVLGAGVLAFALGAGLLSLAVRRPAT